MPIYEFQCAACGHRFDRLQKMADPDPTQCPECAQAQVSRRVTAPSFRLAGAGWYETDFKRDGDKKRNLAGGDEAPKSDASTSTSAPPSAASAKNESSAAPAKTDIPVSKPASTSSGDA